MKYYNEEEYYNQTGPEQTQEEYGCRFCWDKRKNKSKELFFIDAANNMRVCNYCPYCGRDYSDGE